MLGCAHSCRPCCRLDIPAKELSWVSYQTPGLIRPSGNPACSRHKVTLKPWGCYLGSSLMLPRLPEARDGIAVLRSLPFSHVPTPRAEMPDLPALGSGWRGRVRGKRAVIPVWSEAIMQFRFSHQMPGTGMEAFPGAASCCPGCLFSTLLGPGAGPPGEAPRKQAHAAFLPMILETPKFLRVL